MWRKLDWKVKDVEIVNLPAILCIGDPAEHFEPEKLPSLVMVDIIDGGYIQAWQATKEDVRSGRERQIKA
jgi:hypothetical protein